MSIIKDRSESMLRQYLRVVFKNKAVIFLTTFSLVVVVFIGLQFKTKLYEARVKMLISAQKQIESPYYRDLGYSQTVLVSVTQSEIVKSKPIIDRTIITLKLNERPFDDIKRYSSPLKKLLINLKKYRMSRKFEKLPPEDIQQLFYESAYHNLLENVNVEPITNTNLFYIIVRDYSRGEAIKIANVISRSYCIFDLEQQLAEVTIKYGNMHPSVQQLRDDIWAMKLKLSGDYVTDLEAIGPASVKIIEQATASTEPVNESDALYIILAIIMGVLLGTGAAVIMDFMDETFDNPNEIVSYLNIPFLGSIPKTSDMNVYLFGPDKTPSVYSEFYEDLADQIIIYMKTFNIRTVLFASSISGEGTTSIVANIAYYLSQNTNHNTLVMDANLRNPCMHAIFNSENRGLANILESYKLEIEYKKPLLLNDNSKNGYTSDMAGNTAPDANITNTGTYNEKPDNLHNGNKEIEYDAKFYNNYFMKIFDNMTLLPAGTTNINPMVLFDKPGMRFLMKNIKNEYDVVLIDGPNLRDYKDSVILSSKVDGTVLVIGQGESRKPIIKNSLSFLGKSNVIGSILSKREFIIPYSIYKLL